MSTSLTACRRITSICVTVLLLAAALLIAQPSRSVWDGVYTAAQAARGKADYEVSCASCHDTGEGPPLVGDAFMRRWFEDSLKDLYTKMRTTMPAPPMRTCRPATRRVSGAWRSTCPTEAASQSVASAGGRAIATGVTRAWGWARTTTTVSTAANATSARRRSDAVARRSPPEFLLPSSCPNPP